MAADSWPGASLQPIKRLRRDEMTGHLAMTTGKRNAHVKSAAHMPMPLAAYNEAGISQLVVTP